MPNEFEILCRLDRILNSHNPSYVAYVYRLNPSGRPVGSYLLRADPDQCLIPAIQNLGGGYVRILIRDGRTLIFSTRISFAPRLGPIDSGEARSLERRS